MKSFLHFFQESRKGKRGTVKRRVQDADSEKRAIRRARGSGWSPKQDLNKIRGWTTGPITGRSKRKRIASKAAEDLRKRLTVKQEKAYIDEFHPDFEDELKEKWKPVGASLQEKTTARQKKLRARALKKVIKAREPTEPTQSTVHQSSIQQSVPRTMKKQQRGKEMADPKRWTQIDTAARGAHLKPTYSPGSEAAASDPNYNPDAR